MIKAVRAGNKSDLRPIFERGVTHIMTGQHRLANGTLARNRPQPNTLWLDDLFMSVPAIAQMDDAGRASLGAAGKPILKVLQLYCDHARGLASLQSAGFPITNF